VEEKSYQRKYLEKKIVLSQKWKKESVTMVTPVMKNSIFASL